MKRTHIVAAIILNQAQQQVFITKRPDHVHKGGLWEFPGGKVELGESIEQAMFRELEEEIDIQVTHQVPFEHFEFDYTDKKLVFDFMLVTSFENEPYGKEGQQGKWVNIQELEAYDFPEANIGIVKRIVAEFN